MYLQLDIRMQLFLPHFQKIDLGKEMNKNNIKENKTKENNGIICVSSDITL